uniref:QueC-like queuosine biosynthesis family protein n=1 Tax=Burkholderia phage vB_BgluM-SURPRISE13 TaxID=3159457 RepID=A0AAU7PFG3_9VIRU
MSKHPLLVFSGGMDSSYMLWKQLEQGDVHTCYIKATQSQDKIPMELAARKKIIAFFEKKTGNKVLTDTIVDLGDCFEAKRTSHDGYTSSWNNKVPDLAFGQAPVWQFGIQFAADGEVHSKVCMGIVMGDQIAMHLGDLALAWQHTSSFTRMTPIPMEFPLMYVTKDRILADMPLEIIPELWICELPRVLSTGKTIACEDCPACETMAKTVFIWERRKERSLQDAIKERLADLETSKKHTEEHDVERTDYSEVVGSCSESSGKRGFPPPLKSAVPAGACHADDAETV